MPEARKSQPASQLLFGRQKLDIDREVVCDSEDGKSRFCLAGRGVLPQSVYKRAKNSQNTYPVYHKTVKRAEFSLASY